MIEPHWRLDNLFDPLHDETQGPFEYEIQVPGVIGSGDKFRAKEWIFVPKNIEVYFTISSNDVARYLKNGGTFENENGVYKLKIVYFDENANRYESAEIEQAILPGEELLHTGTIFQNPDGTYSLEVKQGMNVLSFKAWQAAINNLSDNIFITQPANRKDALNMINENNYRGAIDKLTNDILEKLNADGRADWVKQPVLVWEIRALTAKLSYEMKSMEVVV